ncbi:GWT1-domain-containing protein [Pseudomassariella vexata]|uniref:GPI-anchored wall transfer protein n=1 Tax=Pseudomassariella vexata TaxID=1141098 RepID=A0A1Y2DEN3_9PEZI|nr:GWT1-domain-containing protein [Pseudomassariella vexata]ORY57728.1 GWT1-domain-containing protein [Pseudomassariella vexata]
MASSNATSYKQLKEDFVSGLSGGSVSEINYVASVASIAIVLWSVLQSRQSFFKPYTPLSFAADFVLNVCAILLAITLYSSTPLILYGLILAPALVVYALPANSHDHKKKPKLPPSATSRANDGGNAGLGLLSIKPFLTHYRGSMLVATCLAILAVDFRLFPRRFAKVETWGTSFMDVGVGSFVFSAGVVAARPVLKERAEGRTMPLPQRLLYSMRHSMPLLVLGVVRLLSVKGLDYAEHVTEYGVHWNFFFTLGLLPPFVAIFQSALKVVPSFATLTILLGVGYQVLLESTSLKAFILLAPRTDLISKNREGICSFVGYVAIFLAGQDAGMYMLPRRINPNRTTTPGTQRNTLLLVMFVWTSIWSFLYVAVTNPVYGAGLDVSRRLANLPYVLWIVAFNNASILAHCLIDTIFFPAFYNATDARSEKEAYETATSRVLRAYNRNGLAVFLLANLLTGLVNMTVPTLDVGPVPTMGILVGYAAVLTGVAVGLDAYDISIKL